MDIQQIFFYIFSAFLLLSALGVVVLPNPVHAALSLVLSFFSAAAMWIMLQAEFLGLLLILVYVGAVMILFLFVVMMVDLQHDDEKRKFNKNHIFALLIGCAMLFQLGLVVYGQYHSKPNAELFSNLLLDGSNTKKLGVVMYTQYILPFEIAALILLVALVAAVIITMAHRKDAKSQRPDMQVQVKASDRLTMVPSKSVDSSHNSDIEQVENI